MLRSCLSYWMRRKPVKPRPLTLPRPKLEVYHSGLFALMNGFS
jgi:hypothetical protein